MSFLNIAQLGWMPHPALMLAEGVAISAALALLARGPVRERVYYGVRVLGCFAAAAFAGGWLMRLIHG